MSIPAEEVPGRVFKQLIDQESESQRAHVRGFAVTQSLRKFMEFTAPADIIQMKANAHRTDQDESFNTASLHGVDGLETYQQLVNKADLHFDKAKHGEFNDAGIIEYLDGPETIDDLTISSVIVKFESESLQEKLRDIMHDALDLQDRQYLQSPFFATMESDTPVTQKEREMVSEFNEEDFLKQSGTRVLRLKSIYSLRAHLGKQDPVMNIGPQKLEDLAINHLEGDRYGLLYSKLLTNKWRSVFGRSKAAMTPYQLDATNDWIPVES